MSESPKIVRETGYSFGKAVKQAEDSKEYWQEVAELQQAEIDYLKENLREATQHLAKIKGLVGASCEEILSKFDELSELKRQLVEGPVCGRCEHKTARQFLEHQIAEGDLIHINTVVTWLRQNTHYGRARDIACSGLKQFAKEWQGGNG